MLSRIKRLRVTPATVIASIALFVALSGVAYAAALPKNSVGTKQIKTNGVSSSEIKTKAVGTSEIKDASIQPGDLSTAAKVSGPTGAAGAAGTARAYGQINNSGPALLAARTKGITAVSRIATGVYCVTPDPALGVDTLATPVIATIEWGNTTAHGGSVEARGAGNSIPDACPTADYAVRTYDAAGTLVNTVAFFVFVP